MSLFKRAAKRWTPGSSDSSSSADRTHNDGIDGGSGGSSRRLIPRSKNKSQSGDGGSPADPGTPGTYHHRRPRRHSRDSVCSSSAGVDVGVEVEVGEKASLRSGSRASSMTACSAALLLDDLENAAGFADTCPNCSRHDADCSCSCILCACESLDGGGGGRRRPRDDDDDDYFDSGSDVSSVLSPTRKQQRRQRGKPADGGDGSGLVSGGGRPYLNHRSASEDDGACCPLLPEPDGRRVLMASPRALSVPHLPPATPPSSKRSPQSWVGLEPSFHPPTGPPHQQDPGAGADWRPRSSNPQLGTAAGSNNENNNAAKEPPTRTSAGAGEDVKDGGGGAPGARGGPMNGLVSVSGDRAAGTAEPGTPPTPPPVLSSTELLSLERERRPSSPAADDDDEDDDGNEEGSTVDEVGPMIHPLSMDEVENLTLPDEPTPVPGLLGREDSGGGRGGGRGGGGGGGMRPCPQPQQGKQQRQRQRYANAGIAQGMSAMYGKLLVVLGFAFPLSEVISSHIPYSFYEGFYLYLYVGCIVFLLVIYGEILCTKRRKANLPRSAVSTLSMDSFYSIHPDQLQQMQQQQTPSVDPETGRLVWGLTPSIHYGSFYLRLGTVAFGVGNMIYSGLEVGQYFEYQEEDECFSPLLAVTPACRIVFTFIQMYFIFLNSKMLISRFTTFARFGLMHMIATNLCIWLYVLVQESKHELLEGYHHLMGNVGGGLGGGGGHHGGGGFGGHSGVLSPSVSVEVHGGGAHRSPGHHASGGGGSDDDSHAFTSGNSSLFPALSSVLLSVHSGQHRGGNATVWSGAEAGAGGENWDALYFDSEANTTSFLLGETNATISMAAPLVSLGERDRRTDPLTLALVGSGPHSIHECLRTNIMGELVQNASPFLFPCVIEYSLICAAILYVMWKNVAPPKEEEEDDAPGGERPHHSRSGMVRVSSKRSRHHYSMDCAGANRGLFTGIVLLVFTIISLILFFVLISKEEMQDLAVFEANVSELVLYATAALASVIGMVRMRRLRYDATKNLELDSILLIIAQTGLFLYSIFIVIGGYFTMYNRATSLMLVTGLTMLGQCILQTMFILDASRRYAHNSLQAREKPGREFVTFLIVSNLAMWAINTLETSRANAHPVHLQFFGEWAWTIIVHISMPLAIFYRFHSTVCLCEVWTKTYKLRELRHAESMVG